MEEKSGGGSLSTVIACSGGEIRLPYREFFTGLGRCRCSEKESAPGKRKFLPGKELAWGSRVGGIAGGKSCRARAGPVGWGRCGRAKQRVQDLPPPTH